MKKLIHKKISPIFNNPKLNLWVEQAYDRLKPVIAYWVRLSPREQQLLGIGGILIGSFIIFSIIGSAMDLSSSLQKDYIQNEQYRLGMISLAKEFKVLNQTTSNEFSQVSSEKIKGDVTQALDVKSPDVTINDNVLVINIANAKFESVMLLLDQLRKSYGIFPTKLKITRLSQSGYVAFTATFTVEQ